MKANIIIIYNIKDWIILVMNKKNRSYKKN